MFENYHTITNLTNHKSTANNDRQSKYWNNKNNHLSRAFKLTFLYLIKCEMRYLLTIIVSVKTKDVVYFKINGRQYSQL
jgi:hypothetical protein